MKVKKQLVVLHSNIIRTMRRLLNPKILRRILAPFIVLISLGVTSRAQETSRLLEYAHRLQASPVDQNEAKELSGTLAQIAERVPWQTELWEDAGIYALAGGEFESAVEYLERAAAKDNLSSEGQIALGDAYQESDNLPAAIRNWEQVVAMDSPSVEVYARLLVAHRELGDDAGAINDLRNLATLEPTQANWSYELGLLLAAREPELALEPLKKAGELDPKLKPSVEILTGHIRSSGRIDEPAFSLLEAGRGLANINQWELAVEAFQRATQTSPEYAEAWAYLGEARQHLEGAGQEQARLELEKALALDPDSLVANAFMSLYWQRQGRYELSLEYLETTIRLDPDNPTLQAELGNTLAVFGELDAAASAYQRAIEISPGNPDYYRLLADFSMSYDYLVEEIGLTAARQAILVAPQEPASLDTMGQVLIRLGDTYNAERFLHQALQFDDNYAPAHLHLGLVYALKGDLDRAYGKFTLASTLAPGTHIADQAQRLLQIYFP